MKHTLLSLLSLFTLSLANPQNYGNNPTSKSTSTPSNTPTAAAAVSGAVHTVTVGDSSFTFSPTTLTAQPGDVIQFQVFSTHSVARSTFGNPCQPISGTGLSVWSGFSSNDNTFFTVTVNDTAPMWLYCAAVGHCQAGMAMVVNPPSGGNNIAAYQAAAKGASGSGTPANIAGGVFGKAAAGAASTSGGGGSATATASAAATSATAASGNGAVALIVDVMVVCGVVLGGAAFVL